MDLSHLLTSGNPNSSLLMQCGFEKKNEGWESRYDMEGTDLYAIYKYLPGKLIVSVYDKYDDEPYSLFEDESSTGKFVTGIRYSVVHYAESFIENTRQQECSMKDRTIHLFSEKYGITYDNPWPNDPKYSENLVFRKPSGKWVGLIMTIPINRLGLTGEQLVDCINLKHRASDMSNIVDGKTVFPAYHMNKKYWITVLLCEKTDWNLVESLVEESIHLVKGL